VRDQLAERPEERFRDAGDRRVLMDAGIVGPVDVEAAVANRATHVEQIPAPVGRRALSTAKARRHAHPRLRRDAAVELTEVVERDLRVWLRRERLSRRRVGAQVSQHAVANAAIGHRTQLLLHALQAIGGG
jgi:hypothetical protein